MLRSQFLRGVLTAALAFAISFAVLVPRFSASYPGFVQVVHEKAPVDLCAFPDKETLRSVLALRAPYLEGEGDKQRMSEASGSGVVVGDGWMLSAAHVTSQAEAMFGGEFLASSPYDEGERTVTVERTLDEYELDAAALTADTEGLRPIPIQLTAPPLQSRVWVVGYPLGLTQTVTEGRYVGLVPGEENYYLASSATAAPGNSGGALLTCEDGEFRLLGILKAIGVMPWGASVFGGGSAPVQWITMSTRLDVTKRELLDGWDGTHGRHVVTRYAD